MGPDVIELTKALEDFGVGPDEDHDSDTSAPKSTVTEPALSDTGPSDWQSIGLLPSWQKLQITLRDAPYSFMTGFRSIRSEEPAQSPTPAPRGPRVATAKTSAKAHASSNSVNGSVTDSDSEALFDSENDDGYYSEEDEEADENEDEEEDEEEDDGEEDEEEAEWDALGRLPTLDQIQFTFRNASELLQGGVLSKGGNFGSNFASPSEFLAKWGYTSMGEHSWQSLMQNFTFPSFLGDDRANEIEFDHYTVEELAELCSEENLSEEDRMMSMNEDGYTGCPHYLRNCKSECAQCKKFYMCQICHDEHETHEMRREETRRMLCLNCQKPQPPGKHCRFCFEVMGDYYCSQCKLWSDDPDKPIYHCDKCNICRVGHGPGIDVFHCDKCGICMSLTVENNHRCIERAANSGCPICLDDLFASTKPTVFMPCGHPIHTECFTEYSKRYYRCPVCAKSILNTSALFRMIDEEVQSEVLPPELANKVVDILCQDCRAKSRTGYHLAGLKCDTCGSYNTSLL